METNRTTLLRVAVLLLTMMAGARSAYPQSGDAALVDQFFPGSLTAESQVQFNNGGVPPIRHEDFVPADLNGTGQMDFLVAAYTNGVTAVVRVLRKQGTSATLVAEPSLPLMGGIIPRVSLLDLDGDRRPEIVVRYSAATGGASTWIFKWTGKTLNVFGPTENDENGDVSTVLNEVGFEDVNGDGIPEILNSPEFKSNELTTVYQLVGGAYVLTSTKIYYSKFFVRRTGAPQTETIPFDLDDPLLSYVMIVKNGDDTGANRASSALITLNGNSVALPSQFNQQVSVLQLPITAAGSNNLGVTFAGALQSEIWVAIVTQ